MHQTKLKRFIAYTSINQLSMCVLALTTSTPYGFISAISHICVYTLTNCVFFYALFKMSSSRSFPVYLSELSKYVYLKPVYSFIAVLTIFSFSGTPPTSLFFTKVLIMKSLIISNKIVILILLLLSSVYSSFYYIKLIKIILTRGVNTSFDIVLLKNDNTVIEAKPSTQQSNDRLDINSDFAALVLFHIAYFRRDRFERFVKVMISVFKLLFGKVLIPSTLIFIVLCVLPMQFLTSLLYVRVISSC